MIELAIKTIKKSFFLSSAYASTQRLLSPSFKKQLALRKKTNIFNYKKLAAPLPHHPKYNIKDNDMYGTAFQLENWLGGSHKDFFDRSLIEHGMVFGNLVQQHVLSSYPKKIITFSEYRKDIIQKRTEKDIICIGPYIHYVDGLLSQEEYKVIKEKLGRTLLVFPTHSHSTLAQEYDINAFCEEIDKNKQGYNTVMVCMYWKDIILGKDKIYKNKGYRIVTAGHKYDLYFLNRLKSIIQLSDMGMSNNIGTHLGYCVHLNKAHYIFPQSIEAKQIASFASKRELSQWKDDNIKSANEIKKLLFNAFDSFEEVITPEQEKIVNWIWGLDKVLTKDQLLAILKKKIKNE